MDKILIICGPTATGKTKFALEIAQKFNGELVSADSQQVYIGRDVITGKDLPKNIKPQTSNVQWRDKYLKYYLINRIKLWLYDVVNPGEPFNVSYWRECANLVLRDIKSRGQLPIVVGGTGLFIKALTHRLIEIDVPYNLDLRKKLENKNPKHLFDYLKKIDLDRATRLNDSDRHNPRRLIRAIEIAGFTKGPLAKLQEDLLRKQSSYLQIGLTASRQKFYELVHARIADRITAGAAFEDSDLTHNLEAWKAQEHKIVRRQLTWFKKQPNIVWFDVSVPGWGSAAIKTIRSWYNKK